MSTRAHLRTMSANAWEINRQAPSQDQWSRKTGLNKKFNGLFRPRGFEAILEASRRAVILSRGGFRASSRSNWRLQPSCCTCSTTSVSVCRMPVFPSVIRILWWNISYLFRDGSKGKLPTFPSSPRPTPLPRPGSTVLRESAIPHQYQSPGIPWDPSTGSRPRR